MTQVSVLIPTRNRPTALASTLTSLYFQAICDIEIIVADQSDGPVEREPSIETLRRLFEQRGQELIIERNLPRRGMAQQRQFLLDRATSPYCLFLDDDVLLEAWVIRNLLRVIREQDCGYVGNAVIAPSYADDVRPHEQHIELWEGAVMPEEITPGSPQWRRHVLHNAANVLHVQRMLRASPETPIAYKVAWIGGCVLFDTAKLRQAGGYGFWKELPHVHCGEDVLAQIRVARRFGGCGVLPSGAWHQELPTTVPDRRVNAPEYFRS